MKDDHFLASEHLLELLQIPQRSAVRRQSYFESLLLLDHGFWQHESDRDKEETFAGFAYRVALLAREWLVRNGARPDAVDARDLSHEILMTFFLDAGKINKNPRAWFYGVAARQAKNLMRRNGLYLIAKRVDDVKEGLSTSDARSARHAGSSVRLGLRVALRQAIRGLPTKQRTIMRMHYIEGLTAQEIAQKTGLSGAAVRQHISRGTKTVVARLMKTAAC